MTDRNVRAATIRQAHDVAPHAASGLRRQPHVYARQPGCAYRALPARDDDPSRVVLPHYREPIAVHIDAGDAPLPRYEHFWCDGDRGLGDLGPAAVFEKQPVRESTDVTPHLVY